MGRIMQAASFEAPGRYHPTIPMSRRNSPPLEAILLSEPSEKPRRSWVPFIMGSILISSVVGGVVLGIWGLIRLMDGDGNGSRGAWASSDAWPGHAEKQAQYREVFRVPLAPVVDADMAQIERVLQQYVTAARYDDKGGLARLVDVDRFERRMQDHPEMPALDGASRRLLKDLLTREVQLPAGMIEYRLMGIRRLGNTGEAVVDVILKDSADTYDPCRFWVKQNHRTWTIIDWELIKQGKSEAEKWASSQKAAQDWLSQSHQDCIDDIQRADACSSKGDYQGAASALHQAEGRTLPYYAQKELQFGIALRFQLYGQFVEAIESCRKIQPPDEVPGVYVIRAICHEAMGNAEEALEAAAEYEELCGFAPDVAIAKAKALERLGRLPEARAEVKRMLEFDPAHLPSLRHLCRLLGPNEKGQLTAILAKAKDPEQIALALGNESLGRDDDESLEAIRTFLDSKWKASPAAHQLAGQLHLRDEEYDKAAARFRQAFAAETDRSKKQSHWHRYVEAMVSAEKLLQAYEESKDPVQIFEFLTSGMEESESLVPIDKLPPLIEAHRKRAPDDPQLEFCAGWIAREKGDLATAEQAFATGLAKAKEDETKSRFQYEHITVMAEQGKILDAYRLYESADDTFSTLAEECRSQHKPDVLEELIRRRRSSHPEDEDVSYYEVALSVERGQYAEALDKIRTASNAESGSNSVEGGLGESLSAGNGNQRLLWLKVGIYEKYDQWQSALETDPQFTHVMPQLAGQLERSEQWDKLRQLLDLYRTHQPSDIQLLLHEMKWSWHTRDYARIEALVPRWVSEQWSGVQDYEQRWARETLVRSLLRQVRTAAAYGFAEQFQREHNEELPMLMTRIAQGNADEVKAIFSRAKGKLYYNFVQDPELFPYLADSRFAELRREFPRDLPITSPRISVVLFLREPLTVDAAKLQRLVPGGGQIEVMSIPSANNARHMFRIRHSDGSCFVTTEDSPYFRPDAAALLGIREGNEAKKLLKEHKAWVAIDLIDNPAVQTAPQQDSFAKRLVAALCDEKVLAIGFWQQAGTTILGTKEGARFDLLSPDRPWKDWLPQGEDVWLPRALGLEQEEPSYAARRKAGRAFAAEVAKLPPGELAQAKVRLNFGHATEEPWLKVVRMEKEEYGGYRLFCELQSDSLIWPHLRSGEPCAVDWWSVKETRLP